MFRSLNFAGRSGTFERGGWRRLLEHVPVDDHNPHPTFYAKPLLRMYLSWYCV